MELTLCADDFGLSRPISETIADLAATRKINAISCMALLPGWETDCGLLSALPRAVRIGLHIVLTDAVPASAMPQLAGSGRLPALAALERLARRRQLPRDEVHAEVEAQIGRFVAGTGRQPDFVDGHQHVHVLPRVRGAVLDAVQRHAPSAWIRDCTDRAASILARPFRLKAIGSAWHSRGLTADAAARDLLCNRGFAGHYDFSSSYEKIFPRFLVRPGPRHLVMCHPGAGRLDDDPIAAARIAEARALRRLPIAELAAAAGLDFDRGGLPVG